MLARALPHPASAAQLVAFQTSRNFGATMSCDDSCDEKYSWGHDATCDLIKLYKKYPELYNSAHYNYKNKGRRLEALKEIRADLLLKGRKTTIEDIKRKIHGLRTQYANQLSKMKKNEEAKPTLWCFNQLEFLTNHEMQPDCEVQESKDFDVNMCEYEDSRSFCDDVKQEIANSSETTLVMPPAVEQLCKDDELVTFAKLVELELRKVTNRQALRKAKKDIICVLMDAQEASDL